MRKIALLTIAIIAILSLMAAPIAFACDGEKTANAETTSSKAACSAKSEAKLTSDKAACSATANAKQASDKAACATKGIKASQASAYACTPEQMEACAKLCDGKGTMTAFAVNGMTCTGCENGLKASLTNVDGVFGVTKVCHKSGEAIVCYDTEKVKSADLIKAITNKGYTAEIIPAVAKTTDGKVSNVDGKKSCSAAEKAACSAAKEKKEGAKGSL